MLSGTRLVKKNKYTTIKATNSSLASMVYFAVYHKIKYICGWFILTHINYAEASSTNRTGPQA